MKINVPELSLVVLVGASGSGKSSFAREHFLPTEVISSDFCRGLVSDDENDQSVTKDAFEVLHFIAGKRLKAGRLTVVDATNVQPEARKPLVALAREHDALPVAVVLNLPEKLCRERNRDRPDRDFGPHVVRNQTRQLRRSLKKMKKEGFRHVSVLSSPEEVESATVERRRLWNNRRRERGPFDIIGDVHGCHAELVALLARLGYEVSPDGLDARSPNGRKAVFLGDLTDRGPDSPGVLRLVMGMARSGSALCVPGNHDIKLVRKLRGRDVKLNYGLAETMEQLEGEPSGFVEEARDFLDGLVSHYVLDGGKLVVAHAGLPENLQGRASGRVREFALFGETTGETDEFGLPVRHDWAVEYRGEATVVYGHTPVPEAEWINRAINVDTGCAFGGKLTALRYPEKELVSVPAARAYYEPVKPFLPEDEAAPPVSEKRPRDLLDIKDVLGKRIIPTRLQRNVTIREENSAAALEVMSRFAIDPRWLIYLPPTMSPSETSKLPGLLEHPAEAFAHYRHEGVPEVICEEKHMGSRAIVAVCKDEEAARSRFGTNTGSGAVYTRTGRPFFGEELQEELLRRLRNALDGAGTWDELATDWLCLDCEILPWSAKAEELLRHQYAAVGAAARSALSNAVATLEAASGRGIEVEDPLANYRERQRAVGGYVEAYRRYSWPVESLDDIRIAPFHIMASEGAVHVNRDHLWHMKMVEKIGAADDLLIPTRFEKIDVTDPESVEEGVRWWKEITENGGEGMVVKPLDFISSGRRGISQPGVKCRGREYLRIIYGPEYTLPANLERLRGRGLGRKRSLALREFALGVEALERFVRREPLYSVHECVFGILALESEPVDPRL
ncbi:MAG: polynucleotide kinase-phosphatase [Rubrobacteraceae bacterium]